MLADASMALGVGIDVGVALAHSTPANKAVVVGDALGLAIGYGAGKALGALASKYGPAVAARIDPDGIVTRYDYQDGLLHKVSVAGGPATVLAYDAAHNLQEVRQPEGQRSTWQHDALGRVVALTDARSNTQQRAYDLLGRLRRIQEPDGNVRTLTYDAEDNVVRAQDVHQDVVLGYTGLDWLAACTQVQYRYDTAGQLTQLLNEQGRTNTFERNAAGQVVAETRFDGQRRRYLLHAAGQPNG